jgi:hypothetical protein
MSFKFEIPRAKFKEASPPLRAPDGRIVPTLTKIRTCPRKTTLGQRNRRHIITKTVDGKECIYHATKGWRVRKE